MLYRSLLLATFLLMGMTACGSEHGKDAPSRVGPAGQERGASGRSDAASTGGTASATTTAGDPERKRELLARLNAVLRRTSTVGAGGTIESGGLVLDAAGHRVTVDGQTVPLGPTEYRLLNFFMEHPERVYSRGQLLDRVWGGNVYVEERTVDVHIRRLRKALEPFRRDALIQTVRGAGYRYSTRLE